MNIQGLQKLTLLDYPEKVACTIFTGGCNFRCPFCHNASLVLSDRENIVPIDRKDQHGYAEEEIFAFLKKRQGVLDGVCVTGGEPLLQPDMESFIRKIKELGYLVKLDTNGSFPEKLKSLVEEQLVDYVAMDIKNDRSHYGETIGIPQYDVTPIEESVRFLMEGTVPFEFRTTITREFHTEERIQKIGEWIAGEEPYFLQAFVDSGDLIQAGLHGWEPEEMISAQTILKEKVPRTAVRGLDTNSLNTQ